MTTNTIQTFIIPEQIGTGFIRSVAIDGKSYFVGKDIAEALGYKDTDRWRAKKACRCRGQADPSI